MRVTAETGWDVTIEVGRFSVPTLSPLEVGEADAARTPTKPGVFVRLWRWLAGEPDLAAKETEKVRALCEMFTPATYRNVTDAMNGGELVALYSAYMGASAAWAGRIKAEAEERAEREFVSREVVRSEKAHGSASRATAPGSAPGNNSVLWPATPLRGGAPVPAVLHGLGVNEVNGMPVEASGEMASCEVGQEKSKA